MAKKKQTYLPLYWCKKLSLNAPYQSLLQIIDESVDENTKLNIISKDRELTNLFHLLEFNYMMQPDRSEKLYTETMSDLNAMAVIKMWSENKQVYKIDKNFADELIKTETIRMIKNAWDYLPSPCFYVDLTDNPDLCKTIYADGFFVYPEKTKNNTLWKLHVCKVTGKFFFSDTIFIINDNRNIPIEEIEQQKTVDLLDLEYKGNKPDMKISTGNVDTRTFVILLLQVLTYLSSVEPDVEENPETKKTYRKSASAATASPKNQYREIQKWDMGVRFGAAFTKWKKAAEAQPAADNTNTETAEETAEQANKTSRSGSRKRPHYRNAHWHDFWYGPHDGERILRTKWLHGMYINVKTDRTQNKNTEMPATIHKVY